MDGGGRKGIPWKEDKGKGRDGGKDNDNNDTDSTDDAGAGDLPPPQRPPPAISVRGTRSCLIHDFLGIAEFKQCLIVPRLVSDSEDKEG